jgi:methylated-DNA-[protein]-cysteine S-methyltransferase
MTAKNLSPQGLALSVFPSELGWMAMRGAGSVLWGLSFGHPTPAAAVAALRGETVLPEQAGDWNKPLRQRLQAYAGGEWVDFGSVEVALKGLSTFRRRVLEICRRIPYGRTRTYGQVAAEAGSPGASRAVGACMAANCVPLVIPCHRVVLSSGALGGFSAPGGILTKRALLELEGRPAAAMLQVG